MSDTLLVGTRKGLFVLRLRAGGWSLDQTHFLGEPVSMLLADRRDGMQYAALNLGHFGVKLWRRAGSDMAWQAAAVPVYPPQPSAAPEIGRQPDDDPTAGSLASSTTPPPVPWSLQQIWSLEAGGADEPGVLWAGTLPGGLFRSADGARSWALNRPLWDMPARSEWFGGGYDVPGIHSVCVDPRDSRHVTIAVSCGGVWQTRDGGHSWRGTTSGMIAGYMPPERQEDTNIQDPHRLVQCASKPDVLWVQHHDGMYRSVDAGERWQRVEAPLSSFGFAVAAHPRDPLSAWFAPAVKDECRVPVDGRLVVNRTRDGGQTFDTIDAGLPPAPGFDLVYRHCLDVNPAGEVLAMGSTTGNLWTSGDGGDHWRAIDIHFPPILCVRFA